MLPPNRHTLATKTKSQRLTTDNGRDTRHGLMSRRQDITNFSLESFSF